MSNKIEVTVKLSLDLIQMKHEMEILDHEEDGGDSLYWAVGEALSDVVDDSRFGAEIRSWEVL